MQRTSDPIFEKWDILECQLVDLNSNVNTQIRN